MEKRKWKLVKQCDLNDQLEYGFEKIKYRARNEDGIPFIIGFVRTSNSKFGLFICQFRKILGAYETLKFVVGMDAEDVMMKFPYLELNHFDFQKINSILIDAKHGFIVPYLEDIPTYHLNNNIQKVCINLRELKESELDKYGHHFVEGVLGDPGYQYDKHVYKKKRRFFSIER